MGDPQLLASVGTAVLAAQPLAVEQVRAGEFGPQRSTAEPVDRLAVEALGGLALAQQRARARLDSQPEPGLPAWVMLASRISASAASWVFPLRTAASISSGSAHMDM